VNAAWSDENASVMPWPGCSLTGTSCAWNAASITPRSAVLSVVALSLRASVLVTLLAAAATTAGLRAVGVG